VRSLSAVRGVRPAYSPTPAARRPHGRCVGNRDHHENSETAYPKGVRHPFRPYVLKFRRPVDPAHAAEWDAYEDAWAGPGTNPEKDAMIALELGRQLGLVEG
jgi:hypothetical protein